MKNIDITINRLGAFTATDESAGDNQCGKVGAREYKYSVAVTGTNKYLDEHGFLLDNIVLHDYFADTYEIRKIKCESCERMACMAIDFIQAYCKMNKVKGVKRIYVEIWGSDKSFIAAEWKK